MQRAACDDGSPRAAPDQRIVGPTDGAVPGSLGRAKGIRALGDRDVRELRGPRALAAQVGRGRGAPRVHLLSAFVPPEPPGCLKPCAFSARTHFLSPFGASARKAPSDHLKPWRPGPRLWRGTERSPLLCPGCQDLCFSPAAPSSVFARSPRVPGLLLQPCSPVFPLARSPRMPSLQVSALQLPISLVRAGI